MKSPSAQKLSIWIQIQICIQHQNVFLNQHLQFSESGYSAPHARYCPSHGKGDLWSPWKMCTPTPAGPVGVHDIAPTVWDELRVMTLVTELVHLIGSFVEVKKVEWLREDVRAVGCVLPFMTDTIFIRAANLLHPLDAIGTTLHELGHVFVRRCGHFHRPGESHCEAWKDATKLLTVLLWRVSRIYVLCCFVLVYIYIYIHYIWLNI